MVHVKQGLVFILSWALLLASSPAGFAQEAPQAAYSPAQIDELVSPIALYPDALVAQILAASTYPDQVTEANTWVQANSQLNDAQRMEQANNQSWDPSVKALTQFLSVLANMAQNLSWTSSLGDAFYNQQQDVMNAIQRLRAQAKAAGNLNSTPQQTVTTETQSGQQVIVIQPASPQVVYVPVYNPTVIYGTPYYPPGYSTGALVAASIISFGAGIAIGAAINGGCCGWGYHSWNTRWYGGGAVVYNRNVYVSNSNIYRRGGYYGNGARPTPYNGGNYNRNGNNYNRNVSGNTVNVNTGNRNNVNTGNINNGNRNNDNINSGNRGNTNVGNGGNRNNGNLGAGNPNAGNVNRPNGGGNANRSNNGGNANRPTAQPAGERGYGQRPAGGNTAFGSYNSGGATRAQSDRGQQSFGGGGARSAPAARGGGGGGRGR